MILFLLGFAVMSVIAGAVFAVKGETMAPPFIMWTLAIVAFTAAMIIVSNEESDRCHSRGGRMVDDGPAYYVKSGDVLIPVQPTTCEVPE